MFKCQQNPKDHLIILKLKFYHHFKTTICSFSESNMRRWWSGTNRHQQLNQKEKHRQHNLLVFQIFLPVCQPNNSWLV